MTTRAGEDHAITIAPPRKLDVRSAALQQACCSCGWRSGISTRGKVNRDANQHARAMAQRDQQMSQEKR